MNPDGQVYFDREDDIPPEDKDRLAEAEAQVLRKMAALEAQMLKEQADAAERARMLDEGGRNDDE